LEWLIDSGRLCVPRGGYILLGIGGSESGLVVGRGGKIWGPREIPARGHSGPTEGDFVNGERRVCGKRLLGGMAIDV